MKRVTGIGGIFFSARDPESLRGWYKEHLGVDVQQWGGAAFTWTDGAGKPIAGTTRPRRQQGRIVGTSGRSMMHCFGHSSMLTLHDRSEALRTRHARLRRLRRDLPTLTCLLPTPWRT
jgi:hypothetical protein